MCLQARRLVIAFGLPPVPDPDDPTGGQGAPPYGGFMSSMMAGDPDDMLVE